MPVRKSTSRTSVFHRLGPRNDIDQVRKLSQDVYVTNFPDHTNSMDLWNLCTRFGKVVDVFISDRKSRMGKNYAFISFIGVSSLKLLVENIRTLWIGSYKLYASISFRRNAGAPYKGYKVKPPAHAADHKITRHAESSNPVHACNTYAGVLKGDRINLKPVQQMYKAPIELSAGDYVVKPEEKNNVVMGRVHDFLTIPNLAPLCMNEGFAEVDIRYMGGLWVMFEFSNAETCSNFKSSSVVKKWFVELRDWNRNMVIKERIAWLDVEGVPVRAWSKTSFKKILRNWGDVLVLQDHIGDNLYCNRICILTCVSDIILEVVQVKVEGNLFNIRVKEVVGWNPSFSFDASQGSDYKDDLSRDHGFYDDDGNSFHSGSEGEFDSSKLDQNFKDSERPGSMHEDVSDDPFGIYDTMANMEKLVVDAVADAAVANGADMNNKYAADAAVTNGADMNNKYDVDAAVANGADIPAVDADAAVANGADMNNKYAAVANGADMNNKYDVDAAVANGADIAAVNDAATVTNSQQQSVTGGNYSESVSHPPGFTPLGSESVSYPPGFTPTGSVADVRETEVFVKRSSSSRRSPVNYTGAGNSESFNIESEATIQMGKILGFDMDGCHDAVRDVIRRNGFSCGYP